ncbi:fimbrial protein [Enterobacter wuhouensis]|uniref:Fimbrial protein n=1 Tax=Enterobacter wuhouensis TaxID=2529381 RepID=A0A4V2LUR8_9ENTR|nr:fimbrial protein [Enterobacter wuhouensis]TCB89955.1 fimbrial protein [Enterobacter wuhouensis]
MNLPINNAVGIVLFTLLFSGCSYADSSLTTCTNSTGTAGIENFDFTSTLTSDQNVAGKTVQLVLSGGVGVEAVCPKDSSNDDNSTYRSYVTRFPVDEKDGSWQYVKLNPYLDGAVKVVDSTAGDIYPPVNYVHMGVDSNVSKGRNFPVDDSDVTLQLKVIQPFIGSLTIPQTLMDDVYVTRDNTTPLTEPVYALSFSGVITVPQTCTVNSDQVISVDFGNINSSAFINKGQIAAGVNPVTKSVPVKCSGGVSATANLSFRFQATADANEPTAVASDNADIGVQFADTQGNVITPNTGTLPFQLNNDEATVSFMVYPVSTTGKEPTPGVFHSQAYIVVDFY